MAIEKSPYEGTFDSLNGRVAIGRVVDVDVPNRRCRVKTMGQVAGNRFPGKGRVTGMGTDDHDVPDVQWITTADSDGGAEDTCIPQIGQKGVLMYINSEPYLIGFFRTMPTSSQDLPPGTEPDAMAALITQGDRVITTIGGNQVILRSGGSIEIRSTAICRTYWLPSGLLTSVCGDYELDTDGGFISWERDKQSNNTNLEFFIQDNQQPTNVVDIQVGNTDDGNTFDLKMGTVNGDTFDFTEVKVLLSIDPSGNVTLQVGQGGLATLTIDASSGKTTFTTKSDLEITTSGNTDVKAAKVTLNGEMSGITTMNSHYGVCDFITGVPVVPSETVFGDI